MKLVNEKENENAKVKAVKDKELAKIKLNNEDIQLIVSKRRDLTGYKIFFSA